MGDPESDKKRYWIRGPRTRLHVYYTPSTDLPGVLLFAFIGALGAVAVVVAARHLLGSGSAARADAVLLAVGLSALVLGCVQGIKLWREM